MSMKSATKLAAIAAVFAASSGITMGPMETSQQSTKDLTKPRTVHATRRNRRINKMRRGGHTFIFGHPNEYKEPHFRRIFAGNNFVQKLRNVLLGRKKAKAARAARKISRPTY